MKTIDVNKKPVNIHTDLEKGNEDEIKEEEAKKQFISKGFNAPPGKIRPK
jgi:hypothetical protein